MTLKDIISQLGEMGSESTKKTLLNHGAKEPFFGLKTHHQENQVQSSFGRGIVRYGYKRRYVSSGTHG